MKITTIKFKYLFLNVVSPVIVGGMIYTFYRDKSILLFDWYNYLDLTCYVLKWRLFFNPDDVIISNIFTQNLPDGLCVYAFSSCMMLIWGEKKTIYKNIYLIAPILLSILSELGQLFNIISGTFDVKDIISYLLFTYLAYWVFKRSL